MAKPTLKITSDFTDQFNSIVNQFKQDAVLVGIPEQRADRKKATLVDVLKNKKNPKKHDTLNNAALLAINNFGSEANHIPPRPVMEIGIRAAQIEIAEQFKLAAKNALTKGASALNTFYNRAGIIAANSVKKVINNQTEIDEPSDATLRARKAVGFKGEKALIVTGQMRNAITHVLKEEEGGN